MSFLAALACTLIWTAALHYWQAFEPRAHAAKFVPVCKGKARVTDFIHLQLRLPLLLQQAWHARLCSSMLHLPGMSPQPTILIPFGSQHSVGSGLLELWKTTHASPVQVLLPWVHFSDEELEACGHAETVEEAVGMRNFHEMGWQVGCTNGLQNVVNHKWAAAPALSH